MQRVKIYTTGWQNCGSPSSLKSSIEYILLKLLLLILEIMWLACFEFSKYT